MWYPNRMAAVTSHFCVAIKFLTPIVPIAIGIGTKNKEQQNFIMKVTIKSLLLILPVVLATSCKPSLKVFSDYDHSADFSSYKTFSLYYLVTSRTVSELNEERIWNYIRTEMIKKGYVEN